MIHSFSAGIDPATGAITTGETVLFWVFAPLMVLAALGLLFAKKAVYATISVVFVMVCLAFIYHALEAPFLGVVQVIVYTGAIMMLFLFVLMLVGVDSSDSVIETLKGQRIIATIGGLGIIALLVSLVARSTTPTPVGLAEVNAESNPVAVATNIMAHHVLTMELTGALLITAAMGAMVLTHKDRLKARKTQTDVMDAKMVAYATEGIHLGQKPNSGVYAESNSAANPALTHGGVPVEESVSRILRIRGQARTVGEISPTTVARIANAKAGESGGLDSRNIGQVGLPGMPGAPAHAAPTQSTDVVSEPSSAEENPAYEDEAQSSDVPTSHERESAEATKPESAKKEEENL